MHVLQDFCSRATLSLCSDLLCFLCCSPWKSAHSNRVAINGFALPPLRMTDACDPCDRVTIAWNARDSRRLLICLSPIDRKYKTEHFHIPIPRRVFPPNHHHLPTTSNWNLPTLEHLYFFSILQLHNQQTMPRKPTTATSTDAVIAGEVRRSSRIKAQPKPEPPKKAPAKPRVKKADKPKDGEAGVKDADKGEKTKGKSKPATKEKKKDEKGEAVEEEEGTDKDADKPEEAEASNSADAKPKAAARGKKRTATETNGEEVPAPAKKVRSTFSGRVHPCLTPRAYRRRLLLRRLRQRRLRPRMPNRHPKLPRNQRPAKSHYHELDPRNPLLKSAQVSLATSWPRLILR
jgi:hypothetical protein